MKKKAEAKFKISAEDKTKIALMSVRRRMRSLRKTVFSLKTSVIGLSGIGGFGLLIKSSLSSIDVIGKMSKTYGIATEELAAFKIAAELGGSSLQTFAKAAKQVSKNTFDFVVKGTSEAKTSFETLGITVEDLKPIMNDNVALIGLIADGLNKLDDGAIKTALAYELLGGRALELLPALSGGTEQLKKYREEAVLFGTALSKDAVLGVEKTNDSISRLGFLFKGLRDQTVAALAPAIKSAVDNFRDWILEIAEAEGGVKSFAQSMAVSILRAIKVVIAGLRAFLDNIDALHEKLVGVGLLEESNLKKEIAGQRIKIENLNRSIVVYEKFNIKSEIYNELLGSREEAYIKLNKLQDGNNSLLDGANERIDELIQKTLKQQSIESAVGVVNKDNKKDRGLPDSISDQLNSGLSSGVSDALNQRVVAIREGLLNEEQMLALSYANRAVTVAEWAQDDISRQKERDFLLNELAVENENIKTEIAKRGEADRRAVMAAGLGAAANIFSSLSSLMGKAGKKQNAMQKVLARAGIIASTAQAIMNALAVPPYPLGASLAVGAALQGAVQLRAVGGSGGGISSPVSSGAAQFQQSQPISQEPISTGAAVQEFRVTVDWENATPDQIDQLAESLSRNMSNGGKSPVAA